MPPRPGEEISVTVLADIHYYFTAPTPKPLYHRFEKSSYLYIYQAQNKARIEIANNPGTPEQDAFQGTLDNVHIQHSTQFPTLCTLTVDGYTGVPQQEASQYDWRLPSTDDPDDLIRINTLDIYFWTLDDANQFLDSVGLLLANDQLETDRYTTELPDQPLSSVVQQLESVAVSHPAYQNGQTPDSRFNPPPVVAGAAPTTQPAPPTLSFAPPPPPQTGPITDHQHSYAHHRASPVSPITPEERSSPENVTPLPYNPAAPAAPEHIKHREKTPPPPEDGSGLAATAAADAGIPYTPPHQMGNNVGISSFAPPPTGMQYNNVQTGYASPPPSAGLARAGTFPLAGPGSALQSPVLPSYQQSFLTGQPHPGASGMPYGSQDPNAHLYSQQGYATPQQSPPQHQPPVGISGYSYDQSQPQAQPLQRSGSEYDIHSQVYRPTQEEVRSHAQKHAHKAMKAPGERPHKIEDKAHKMEGGVNRFLKRLEKKLG
ncbi:hypothetical protein N7466_000785 [Penicillium verhagenii]|uniref:uncharacterized protein n=1 Tax=Penicillium verhagenii TaxID=1562060 RepID=UPI00254582CE|nr:uncharacterized protein N7466_000785 [Penicillium verhagenii]KAJ5947770.1 hypothetical protein N7466_000785 [Penicillium verhagenii]